MLERSEKQALLAKQAQKLVLLLDDSPIVPGQERTPFSQHEDVRDVINEAEAELRAWTPSWQHTGSEPTTVAEPSFLNAANGEGKTSDGSHLAEVTHAPPPTHTHADLYHEPASHPASTTATDGVALPGEAGNVQGSDAPQVVEHPHVV